MKLSDCVNLRKDKRGLPQQTTREEIIDHAMSKMHRDGCQYVHILTILRTWVGSQDEHPGRA
jgi:hypothetical protein